LKTRASVRSRAFTLIEVVLAILIISGIMTVLLYFYQRAAEVRQIALEEAQYLAESRMFLDQVVGELRTARIVQDQFVGFEGSSNSLTFICTTIPRMARWIANTNEPVNLPPATDLKRVHYSLLGGTNLLAIRGLDRNEALLLGTAYMAGTNATEFIDPMEATNSFAEPEMLLIETNQFARTRLPLTERIQYLHFRFWDGTAWLESWSGMDLPNGVEISLGREPMPADGTESYPFDLMRRVVYLPNSTHPDNKVAVEPESEEFAL
jgi:type II secretory pathway pseudopilin PulG